MHPVDIRQAGKVDNSQLSSINIQCGLLYLSVHTHGFAVLEMLDTGATQSFVSQKLAVKLLATVQTTMPLTVILPMGKIMVATSAIQLDMLINNFIYMQHYYILLLKIPLILGNDICMSYRITLDLA